MQRGSEFWIMAGPITLMNSRLSGSEVALARLACERIRQVPRPRLLIGGLGMGFTLRAALAELGAGGGDRGRRAGAGGGSRGRGGRCRACSATASPIRGSAFTRAMSGR